ncbi:hypothetical protein LTS10_013256 [Elasticomyces elasticus]|nr:hypothetical protein LTS10_013256 [Elasticomyces elasticus]
MPEQVTKSNNSFVDYEGQPVLPIVANILTIIAAIAQIAGTAMSLYQRARANLKNQYKNATSARNVYNDKIR